jgi:3-oxoadipate enol-lactonase
MDFISTDGATIHAKFSTAHSERTLILVNGYTRPMTDFNTMLRFLNDEGINVLIFDNRGAGKSTQDRPYTDQDMIQDIFTLADHYDVQDFFLLGISMGGVLAQRAYCRLPNRIRGLILVSTTCEDSYMSTTQFGQDLNTNLERLRDYFAPAFFDANQPLIKAMAKQITSQSTQESSDQKKAFKDFNTRALLPMIQCKVFVIHGKEDKIISPKVVDVFAHEIPDCALQLYSAVGHLILAENPKQFYQDVAEFVNALILNI